jgi:anti-sigma factor RsiW
MKWFSNPCRRYRKDLSLLASGVLADSESGEVKSHLAACPDGRNYYAEMKAVVTPLAHGPQNLEHIEPTQAARNRWARDIQAAGRPKLVHHLTTAETFREWYCDVIWSSRRVWAGLAAVWLLILAGHVSLGEHLANRAAKFSPASQAMIMAVKDRDNILAEILADHSIPRDADRPKFFLPKPRTQHLKVFIL